MYIRDKRTTMSSMLLAVNTERCLFAARTAAWGGIGHPTQPKCVLGFFDSIFLR